MSYVQSVFSSLAPPLWPRLKYLSLNERVNVLAHGASNQRSDEALIYQQSILEQYLISRSDLSLVQIGPVLWRRIKQEWYPLLTKTTCSWWLQKRDICYKTQPDQITTAAKYIAYCFPENLLKEYLC
jgi:hypothetical protein